MKSSYISMKYIGFCNVTVSSIGKRNVYVQVLSWSLWYYRVCFGKTHGLRPTWRWRNTIIQACANIGVFFYFFIFFEVYVQLKFANNKRYNPHRLHYYFYQGSINITTSISLCLKFVHAYRFTSCLVPLHHLNTLTNFKILHILVASTK